MDLPVIEIGDKIGEAPKNPAEDEYNGIPKINDIVLEKILGNGMF